MTLKIKLNKVMAVSSSQLALILRPSVVCVFLLTPVAPCQFTPLLNLQTLIFSLMFFGWLHPGCCEVCMKLTVQNKTGKLCSHCKLQQSLCTCCLVQTMSFIYLQLFNSQFLFNPQMP
jgi:hypothetical protein